MRETKRRKGGSYAHVGAHDQDNFDDDDDDGHDEDVRNGKIMTLHKIWNWQDPFRPLITKTTKTSIIMIMIPSEFSIDEFDDDADGDDDGDDDGDENYGDPLSPRRIQSNYSMD